ncbi:unnamed protein product, partial [Brassica oleracea]
IYFINTIEGCKEAQSFFLICRQTRKILPLIIAIVTCLNCCQYPANRKKRMKKHISEKPY